MKAILDGTPKEIADLVLEIQGRQNQRVELTIDVKEVSHRLSQLIEKDCTQGRSCKLRFQ